MKTLTIMEDDVNRLKAIRDRLYTEDRLNGDEMRDLAQRIGLVIENTEYLTQVTEGSKT